MIAEHQKYRYAFGGYVLDTNIYFPELIASSDNSDCSITVKYTIPDDVDVTTLQLPYYNNEQFKLLQIKQSNGWIFLRNYKHAVFVPNEELDQVTLRTFVLTSVFAVMSVALGFLPFHASAVVLNGKTVLFCGNSGVGKSTLAAYFYSKNYAVLSDDVTNVKAGPNGGYFAYPSVSRIKLSVPSLNLIGIDETGLDVVPLKKHKFSYPVTMANVKGGYPLAAIVFPTFADETSFEKCVTLHSKMNLASFLFRRRLTKPVYSPEYKNTSLFQIALTNSLYTFSRPNDEATMAESAKYIEHKLLEVLEN